MPSPPDSTTDDGDPPASAPAHQPAEPVTGTHPAACALRLAIRRASIPGVSRLGRLSLPRVFLEDFSGSGHLAKAVHALGYVVLCWDISMGASYDLTNKCNRQLIQGWVLSGQVWGVHMGTPCSSFSRARRGKPPPLRDRLHIMGLPNLSDKDQVRVQIVNLLMRFSFKLLLTCRQQGIPATIENPATSMLWWTPQAQQATRWGEFTSQTSEF